MEDVVYFTGGILTQLSVVLSWQAFVTYIFTLCFLFPGLTECDYYKTEEYNYTHFVELNKIEDTQPTGFYARVPVYVIGPRDAHIILSTTDKPNRDKDFVYEFCKLVFGSYFLSEFLRLFCF